MPNDRQQRAAQIVTEAFGRPTVTRGDFIADACGDDNELHAEVEALLAADVQAGSFLDKPVVRPNETPAIEDPLEGSTVEGFRIVRRLAAGGMGVVYEAQQQTPARRVALKVIRAGAASPSAMRRFEHEADVLARLQHPGIAQIFEAGTFDTGHGTQPFFAMELIDGQPLTAFAESSRLDIRGRLELFARICDAVHYAHQKGVVHRDLKPGNVLVGSDGQPKVVDFGVARITDADIQATTLHTRAGELIGTIPYMSPEQVLGDADAVDTRSDVYALGVVLYELLSGRLPHDLRDKAIPEAARIIREQEITSLSSVSRVFRGDIDTIVARALEKDPGRRYPSAAELAADVRRYLDDEPIMARPASAMYQIRKFTRRNKVVVGGVAAIFMALVAGAVMATWGLVQANEQRETAETESASLAAINEFLNDLLTAADPRQAHGREVTVREVLDKAAGSIEGQFADQPLVEAQILKTIGYTYRSLGTLDAAEPHLRRAWELQVQELGAEHPDTLSTLNSVAIVYMEQGHYDQAEACYLEALDLQKRVLGEEDPATLRTMANVAILFVRQGRYDDAEPLFVSTFELRERVLGAEHRDTLDSMNNLGAYYFSRERYDDAEPLYLKTLELRKRLLGEEHPRTLGSMGNLAELYVKQERYGEAQPLLIETLELKTRLLGEGHPSTFWSMDSLANLYSDQGRYDEAEILYIKAVETSSRVSGEEHPDTLIYTYNLAHLYDRQGRHDDAEPLYLTVVEGRGRTLGREHPDTLVAMHNLAALYAHQGRDAEAELLFLETLEIRKRVLGEKDPAALFTMTELAALYQQVQRLTDAEELYVPAVQGMRAVLGIGHVWTRAAMDDLATVYQQQGRHEQALALRQELLEYLIATAEETGADAAIRNDAAWVLLTAEPAELRDVQMALQFAIEANEATGYSQPGYLDTLSLAYHHAGDTISAIQNQRKAIALLPPGDSRLRDSVETALAEFEAAMQNEVVGRDGP